MQKSQIIFFLFLCCTAFGQDYRLSNEMLIQYYQHINKAERNIVENKPDSALVLFKKAFTINDQPHAKDLYNSMQVALKLSDKRFASKQYHLLKCMHYDFDEDFLKSNPNLLRANKKKCKMKFNDQLRTELDSLIVLDQKYRRLSGGDYNKYKKEMTTGDSITSLRLSELIQQHGFPNEYDLSLKSADSGFFHDFYLIILHQLAGNHYSPQRVNFSEKLFKALNEGKITPGNATFLIDWNNDTHKYDMPLFSVKGIVKSDGIGWDKKGTEKVEYYYSKVVYPENQNEKIKKSIEERNLNRKKMGMSSVAEMFKKSIFRMKNKTFIFPDSNGSSSVFSSDEDIENYKKRMGLIRIE